MAESIAIGEELARYAEEEAEFTAQRGMVEELFPYIWMASRRMSLRAIVVWLAKERRVSLSANTLARAMRTRAKYWTAFYEHVMPAATVVGDWLQIPGCQVLAMEKADFDRRVGDGIPRVVMVGGVSDEKATIRLAWAIRMLVREWWGLPFEAREECQVRRISVSVLGSETAASGGVGGRQDECRMPKIRNPRRSRERTRDQHQNR